MNSFGSLKVPGFGRIKYPIDKRKIELVNRDINELKLKLSIIKKRLTQPLILLFI